jgi:hypothetical protein
MIARKNMSQSDGVRKRRTAVSALGRTNGNGWVVVAPKDISSKVLSAGKSEFLILSKPPVVVGMGVTIVFLEEP